MSQNLAPTGETASPAAAVAPAGRGSAAVPPPAQPPAPPARHTLLEKLTTGSFFCGPSWVPRYFVSKQGQFGYCRDDGASGNIDVAHDLKLRGVEARVVPGGTAGRHYVFSVRTAEAERTYYVAAPDQAERDAWVAALAEYVAALKAGRRLSAEERRAALVAAGLSVPVPATPRPVLASSPTAKPAAKPESNVARSKLDSGSEDGRKRLAGHNTASTDAASQASAGAQAEQAQPAVEAKCVEEEGKQAAAPPSPAAAAAPSVTQPAASLPEHADDTASTTSSHLPDPETVPARVLQRMPRPPSDLPVARDGTGPVAVPGHDGTAAADDDSASSAHSRFVGHLLTHLWSRVRAVNSSKPAPSFRAVREGAEAALSARLTGTQWQLFIRSAVEAMVAFRFRGPAASERVRRWGSEAGSSEQDDDNASRSLTDFDDAMSVPSSAASLDAYLESVGLATPRAAHSAEPVAGGVPKLAMEPSAGSSAAVVVDDAEDSAPGAASEQADPAAAAPGSAPPPAADAAPPSVPAEAADDKPGAGAPSAGGIATKPRKPFRSLADVVHAVAPGIAAAQRRESGGIESLPAGTRSLAMVARAIQASRAASSNPALFAIMEVRRSFTAGMTPSASFRSGSSFHSASEPTAPAADLVVPEAVSVVSEASSANASPKSAGEGQIAVPVAAAAAAAVAAKQAEEEAAAAAKQAEEEAAAAAKQAEEEAAAAAKQAEEEAAAAAAKQAEEEAAAAAKQAEEEAAAAAKQAEEEAAAAAKQAEEEAAAAAKQAEEEAAAAAKQAEEEAAAAAKQAEEEAAAAAKQAEEEAAAAAAKQAEEEAAAAAKQAEEAAAAAAKEAEEEAADDAAPSNHAASFPEALEAAAQSAGDEPGEALTASALAAPADACSDDATLPESLGPDLEREVSSPGFVAAVRELNDVVQAVFAHFASDDRMPLSTLEKLCADTYLLAPPRLTSDRVGAVFSRLIAEAAAVAAPGDAPQDWISARAFTAALVMFSVLRYPESVGARFEKLVTDHLMPFANAHDLVEGGASAVASPADAEEHVKEGEVEAPAAAVVVCDDESEPEAAPDAAQEPEASEAPEQGLEASPAAAEPVETPAASEPTPETPAVDGSAEPVAEEHVAVTLQDGGWGDEAPAAAPADVEAPTDGSEAAAANPSDTAPAEVSGNDCNADAVDAPGATADTEDDEDSTWYSGASKRLIASVNGATDATAPDRDAAAAAEASGVAGAAAPGARFLAAACVALNDSATGAAADAAAAPADSSWSVDVPGVREALKHDVVAVRGVFEHYALRWRTATARAGRPINLAAKDQEPSSWWMSGVEVEAFATEFGIAPALMTRAALSQLAAQVVADDAASGGHLPSSTTGIIMGWEHFQELLARVATKFCARPKDAEAGERANGLFAMRRLLRTMGTADAATRITMGPRGSGALRFAASALPLPADE
ncbi:hypothetical protein FNF31_04293 [Cafeteria roenbergensis]|uniref:PH domain-containing protein n=1 Tax=Cafeteria roenbergensis TaxID=33653 RepID=A0A5A8D733_CAFRO|nr:hypothetical protein FNF31_04293 [Cafeteria roenbergensis]